MDYKTIKCDTILKSVKNMLFYGIFKILFITSQN